MEAMPWRKLYREFANDPLFLRAADETGAHVGTVKGLYADWVVEGGSVAAFNLDERAWYYREPVEVIERLVAWLRGIGKIIGDKLAAFARRQDAKGGSEVATAATRPTSSAQAMPHAAAQRRYMMRKRLGGEQLALLLPVDGDVIPRSATIISPSFERSAAPRKRETQTEEYDAPRRMALTLENDEDRNEGDIDAKRKGKSRRGSRLPIDWEPSEADCQFAAGLGVDIYATAAEFRDYWIAEPGAKAAKLDWSATFRNQCRRVAERARSLAQRGSGSHGREPSSILAALNRTSFGQAAFG